MKRQGGSRGQIPPDRNQLSIDWEASAKESKPAEGEPTIVAPTSAKDTVAPGSVPRRTRRRHTDIVARLPVPKPLPASVAAGHFGHDEDGKVIRPAADEIRAITES